MQRIQVSENGRFFSLEDGSPFFWLGDTAWELFHALTVEEAELYFKTRSNQGYNVVQAVALAEQDGLRTPNAYGRTPLKQGADGNFDPLLWDTDGDYSYWAHVDRILDLAEQYGIYIAFLPTWGDKYFQAHGVGPVIFSPENAREYGRMIGTHFGKRDNILWVLGGDRTLLEYEHFRVNVALAEGIRETEDGRHLMTLHPPGNRSSSYHFPSAGWLDFHMLQSGHNSRNWKNYEMIAHDYGLEPIKPVLDAEPRYEDHPVNFNAENGYFDEADVRQAAYWSVFAGACGHTYGHHSVWSMNREFSAYFPLVWQDAINRPGSRQMQHLKNLLLSRDYFSRVPDQGMVAENYPGANYISATRGADYALFYAPNGMDIRAKLGVLPGGRVKAQWFNPKNGEYAEIGIYENSGERLFSPAARGRDCDIVLCLTSMNG